MVLKPGSHANEFTFVLEHRSMASFDFCSSSNTFVSCTVVTRTHARTHTHVYMRLDILAGMNIKTTVVLDVRPCCVVKLHCVLSRKIDPNAYAPRDIGG